MLYNLETRTASIVATIFAYTAIILAVFLILGLI